MQGTQALHQADGGYLHVDDMIAGLPRDPRAPGVPRATKGEGLVVGSRFLNFPIQNRFPEIGSHRMSSDWRASL